MRHPILTGLFALSIWVASFALASADEASPPTATSGASTLAAAPVPVTPALSDVRPETAPLDAAEPGDGSGAGADVGLVNPALLSGADASALQPKHINRLRRFANGIISRSSAIASSLTRSAMRFIGTPYVFGGTRSSGFDCSGYVQHVFAMIGFHLPRTADAQYDAGRRIAAAMVPGDLVFFHTYAPGVSHVGIYLGHNKFIHSSSSHGVSIASLHDSYWAPRYLGAKRVFGQ